MHYSQVVADAAAAVGDSATTSERVAALLDWRAYDADPSELLLPLQRFLPPKPLQEGVEIMKKLITAHAN